MSGHHIGPPEFEERPWLTGLYETKEPTINITIASNIDWEKIYPNFQMAMAGVQKAALEKLFDDIVAGIPRQAKFVFNSAIYAARSIEAARPFWDKANMFILGWIPPWRWYWNKKASEAMDAIEWVDEHAKSKNI